MSPSTDDVRRVEFTITVGNAALATTLYTAPLEHTKPDGQRNPRPILLLRTPYRAHHHEHEAHGWVRRGLNVAVQDVRGRGASTGEFEPYQHEQEDGAATFDHLLTLPDCDGRIIAYGGSYAAHCALALSHVRPVAGIMALVPCWDSTSATTENGGVTPLLSPAWWWWNNVPGRGTGPRGIEPRQFAQDMGEELLQWRAPAPWPQPTNSAHAWSLPARASEIPLLVVSGVDDGFAAEAQHTFLRWPGPAQCYIGQWDHSLRRRSGAKATDPGAIVSAWCAEVLRGAVPSRALYYEVNAEKQNDATIASSELIPNENQPVLEKTQGTWVRMEEHAHGSHQQVAQRIVRAHAHGTASWTSDSQQPFPSWLCPVEKVSGRGAGNTDAVFSRPDQSVLVVDVRGPLTVAGTLRVHLWGDVEEQSQSLSAGDSHGDTFAHLLIRTGRDTRWAATAGVRRVSGEMTIVFPVLSVHIGAADELLIQFTSHDFPVHEVSPGQKCWVNRVVLDIPVLEEPELEATTPDPRSLLVDPICGIIRELHPMPLHSDIPKEFHCVVSEVSDPRQFSTWLADKIAGASGFSDPRELYDPAIGEAVERYCGNNIPSTLRRASIRELRESGINAISPAEFPGLPPERRKPHGPFDSEDPDMPILWAQGRGAYGRPILVPGSRVYLNWNQGSRRSEPRTHHIAYAGIAAGPTLRFAELSGFTECVERDATTAWWSLGLKATPLNPASVPGLKAVMEPTPFHIHLLLLPSPLGIPVVSALVWHPELRIPGAGFSCHGDPIRAVWKALSEAFQVWTGVLGVKEPDGGGYKAIRQGVVSPRAYFPFRADGRYLDDAGENFVNVRDLACQAQLWLDERLHPYLERFRPDSELVDISTVPAVNAEDVWDRYRDDPANRVAVVDVTTADIALSGLRVVRVCTPRLLPNFPPAFPTTETPRWAEYLDYVNGQRDTCFENETSGKGSAENDALSTSVQVPHAAEHHVPGHHAFRVGLHELVLVPMPHM
ncbi:CocE/NonD family hydrolase [Corynebacterium anserum]|uniref:CocE/NonD family hydrolase n=1 Tax=Corynebacterium anserum TaxID=2684406 RepID=A0A7G7YQ00_9CORY|nr:CocE/NonD family hydrolase [Corynebacterium anserum]QNH96570.1 CocE/NonD family hydrolase [Corynebacterium anserum]